MGTVTMMIPTEALQSKPDCLEERSERNQRGKMLDLYLIDSTGSRVAFLGKVLRCVTSAPQYRNFISCDALCPLYRATKRHGVHYGFRVICLRGAHWGFSYVAILI